MRDAPASIAILCLLSLIGCTASAADPESDGAEQPDVTVVEGTHLQPGEFEPPECATPPSEVWEGQASRVDDTGHPDDVMATVFWRRVSTDECVDTYQPEGVVRAVYAVPGALCTQTIDPDTTAIDPEDGILVVDRAEEPVTYRASGSTVWSMTWTCQHPDGTIETATIDGGGTWLEASGLVHERADGRVIEGDEIGDRSICAESGSSRCILAWSFVAVE